MMSYIVNFQKLFFLILLSFFLLSCENTDDKQTIKEIAITLIAKYADGTGQPPTIRNYEDAGIIGVNEKNINELNAFVETLRKEDINTEDKLNKVIDSLGVSIASDIFAPVITIFGANPLTIEVGTPYKDPKVTAIDNRDGAVTVYCKGEVNSNKLGKYIVTHSAVDEAGNLASLDRIVNVVAINIAPSPSPSSSPSPSPSPSPQHYIHFTIEQDSFLPYIDVTINNTSNGDSLVKHWVYPSDPNAILSLTMAVPLIEGEAYVLEIPSLSTVQPTPTPTSSNFQDNCYFSYPISSSSTNGTMGTTDITLPITCSNAL